MRFFFFLVGAILLVGVVRVASLVIPVAGFFREVPETDLSRCRSVKVAPGTEDVEIDPQLNVAFVSASERRSWYNRTSRKLDPSNGIYAVSLDGSDQVRRVSPDEPKLLAHGISLWRGPDGGKRLFVVNHQPRDDGSVKESVELFQIGADATLIHIKSVSFSEMYSPNDVVAVGPEAFYATNDRRYEEGILSVAEIYLGLSLSSVVYWDGSEGRQVAGGLMYANGINKSVDGSAIYVAEVLGQRIQVFGRDSATGDLTKSKALPIDTGPDNISVDGKGMLYIGGHPYALEFQKHAKDPSHISPSQVVSVDPSSGATETVFYSKKGEINGSSVGAAWAGGLVVGAVFDEHVMICSRD